MRLLRSTTARRPSASSTSDITRAMRELPAISATRMWKTRLRSTASATLRSEPSIPTCASSRSSAISSSRDALRRHRGHDRLEQEAELVRVDDVGRADLRGEVALPRDDPHELVLLQREHRLAYRRAGDGEPIAQLRVPDPLARLDHAVDQVALDGVVHARSGGQPAHARTLGIANSMLINILGSMLRCNPWRPLLRAH